MFQPNRMNEIDNFFMRNNNQVTPKRSYSPRLTNQMQENQRGSQLQYFPSNKENHLPNRTSVSPSKINFARKPMINAPGHAMQGPSLLVSPRNKNSHGLVTNNTGYNNYQGGFQQQLHSNPFTSKNHGNGPTNNLLKRFQQNSNDVQFIMSKGVQYCQNHSNKIAQFTINIQGQNMQYCSVCASKLASQGFTVIRLITQSQKSSRQQIKKPKSLPNYSQYRGNPFYQEIMQFLKQLVGIQGNHYQIVNKFFTLESHYTNQIQLTTQYYDQVLKILTEMKEEHLQDLQTEKQKYLQIADIQNDYLNENIQQITYMREDIETNIPSIVTDIEEESFKQCIYEYRQKLTMLKHSLEQKEDTLKDVTNYDIQSLKKKVQNFENAMKELWQDEPQQHAKQVNNYNRNQDKYNQQKKQHVSIKNMHKMAPTASVEQNQGQGAFRHLFGDDQEGEQNLPIPSPQFKKI